MSLQAAKVKADSCYYLFQAVEVILHAFDSYIFAVLDALGFEHFREGALSFLGNKTILCKV